MDGTELDTALFRLDAWDRLTSLERQRVASEVARGLPEPFALVGLEGHSLGGQSHEVPIFDHEGRRFALLPGNEAVLGYDRRRPFSPKQVRRSFLTWCARRR